MDNTIFLKYNKPGPRYTSYPPANFFNTNYTEDDYKKSLILSNQQEPQNISLYIHIPFCPKLCFFCGCNTAHMQKNTLIERYIKAIIKEIKSVSKYINKSRKITQIHWGGGTPNSISISLIAEIMDTIRSEFSIAINHEIAMECNPAYLEFEHIKQFSEIGFNRLSLGIQDFDNNILKNLNREPSKYPINDLAKYIKQIGFQGLNIDLIYGLPGQTIESFKRNIEKAIEISPERLVTFSYAHIPWIKPMQKKLEKIGLPTTEEKINMFFNAYNMLTKNGYTAIGMDHYAKPNDSLSIALKQKKLHRNFQGYCTKETTGQVYGFGATAITQLDNAYIQNIKDTNKYIESIENNSFAIERGYKLSIKEKIIRYVINEIMCNGYLNMPETASKFAISTDELKRTINYFPEKFQTFIDNNLLSINNDILELKSMGFLVVRNIAMAFDPMLKSENNLYSKTV